MPIQTILPLAGAWLWSNYGKTLAGKAFSAGKDKWDESKWNEAAEKYRGKIIKLYDSMQIMGMAKPVPLDDIFTEAYMLDKPTAFGRFDIERLKQKSAADPAAPPPETERLNGLRLVGETKRNLFILGKPGAGKTTFLKYIAIKAAEKLIPGQDLKQKEIDKVPVFVSLKQWADSGAELMDFITQRFDICGFPDARPFVEELLKSGGAIVLFDGLDEVNQEDGQRDRQTRQMNNFIEKYDRTQCLITCRVAASDYSFEPFTYVEIADFTEAQIQTFVRNWFRKEGKKDEATAAKFLAEFAREDNEGLRDLARTPLLLTLLCLAYDETLTIPQRRADIYKEAVDALLKKWDSSRRIKRDERDEVYRKLSVAHKENMLARVAAETFERNEYFIPQPELERLITDYVKNVPPHNTNEATDGEVILKAIAAQHGIFVERARAVYSFSHLTFQEYFTAKYLADNAAKGTLTNLIMHCADARWREVFLLTTSLLPDAGHFMKTFRCSVDELLGGDEGLQAVLVWADKKSTLSQAEPWLVRHSYLFADLYYPSQNPDLYLLLARAHSYNHAYDLGLDLDLDFDLYLAPILARLRDLALDFNHTPGLVHDHARAHDHVRDRARELGLNEFAKDLDALSLPTHKAPASEWQMLADKFQALMIKHRDIGHNWNLTDAQEAQLADYLNATRLLKDCLELAVISPDEKKAMLDSLYLPPAGAGET
jgi:predicted NACHT family NTPase